MFVNIAVHDPPLSLVATKENKTNTSQPKTLYTTAVPLSLPILLYQKTGESLGISLQLAHPATPPILSQRHEWEDRMKPGNELTINGER